MEMRTGMILTGNHRCSAGGRPGGDIPKGAGQNGWDDREVVDVPTEEGGEPVKEEELSSHF